MRCSRRTRALSWFSTILVLAGLAWVGYLLITTLDHPARFIPAHGEWLILATLLMAAYMLTSLVIFHTFIAMQNNGRCSRSFSAYLFLIGQLLRYLPGRVWGVVYQVGITRDQLPAALIVRVNLDMMIFMLIGNSMVAVLLLGHQLQWPTYFLVATMLSGVAVLAFLFAGGANWLLRLPANWLPVKLGNLLHALADSRTNLSQFRNVVVIFIVGWILYLGAWNLLGAAYPLFSEVDFVALCAFYTLASLVGVLSTITPAGLGVREATFIVLAGTSADLEAVAFFALFARIWLVAVELSLLLIFWGFLRITK